MARTNWTDKDTVKPADMNQIGQEINANAAKMDAETGHRHTGEPGDAPKITSTGLANDAVTDAVIGDRTIGDTAAPTGDTGQVTTLFGWLGHMIKSITGKANWRTLPAITLEDTRSHVDATSGVHGATSAATANRLIIRDANGRAQVAVPSAAADIARKDTVDAVQTNLSNHIGSGGSAHATATTSAAGFMSAADKVKSDAATASATANTLMLRDSSGRAKVAAPSASDDIARKAEVDAVQSNLTAHIGSGGSAHAAATTNTAGFMSATDKSKLNGIQAGAEVNAVTSVAGKTGAVTLAKADVGLGNVDNYATATQAEARAGNATNKFMTPALVKDAINALTSLDNLITKQDNYRDDTALPSTYDRGVTVFFSNNPTNRFNALQYCTVMTIKGYSTMPAVQFIYPYNRDAPIYYRYALYNNDTWLAWRALATDDVATSSLKGLMSAVDKAKLDGVSPNANNYVHPSGDGNQHIPATGTSNNGKVLKAGSTPGSAAWATLTKADISDFPASLPANGGNADTVDGFHANQFGRARGSVAFGNELTAMTTQEFISLLTALGAFEFQYWVARGSWSYANNRYINDTGVGDIHLAGCVVEVISQSSSATAYTIRINTPTTSTRGATNTEFVYVYNGPDYSPGWRKIWNDKNDGADSGLDADLLDGQQGSYYLNASNLNAGTVPAARLPVATTSTQGVMSAADKSKLDGIQTGAQVNTVTSVAGKTGAVTLAKADVGLGSVQNYGIATQAEAEAGASASKYMTPQRTAQAIAKLAVGQRTATIVVAASNSSEKSKKGADYVCDGTDDQEEINAAVLALPNVGGQVLLMEGDYNLSAPITLSNRPGIWSPVILRGMGVGGIIFSGTTRLIIKSANAAFDNSSSGRDYVISDMCIQGDHAQARGFKLSSEGGASICNVLLHQVAAGDISDYKAAGLTIYQCKFINCSDGLNVFSSGSPVIADNYFYGCSGIALSLKNNGRTGIISRNRFLSCNTAIYISSGTGSIQDNLFESYNKGIEIGSGAAKNLVTNNYFNTPYSGGTAIIDSGTGTVVTAGNKLP